MRSKQEITQAHDLLAATLQVGRDNVDPDFKMILLASLDVLAWVLELQEGETFQSLIEMHDGRRPL